eukprot:TRINITY_DN75495_c0_g1_i1.p1 TRINITY_DN75495_c0_g1~~TRINITY_DN75495_c0_g1_i1.p1  ORF type:complete len:579 (-),score=74.29 TRINITY_DN75495_c0_g1_i1:229-1965(-)
MGDRLIAFATRKADEALACFKREAWLDGLARARAALDLFARSPGEHYAVTQPLTQQAVDALLALGSFCEASEFLCEHARTIADGGVRDRALATWHCATNAVEVGDIVQLHVDGRHEALAENKQTGTVVANSHANPGGADGTLQDSFDKSLTKWRVRLHSKTSSGEVPALTPASTELERAKTGSIGNDDEEQDVCASQLTLLTLKLTQDQRERWELLLEERPALFGERIKPENEARWQKLFGGCAARGGGRVGAGAANCAADLGLPLEQSFAATLYSVVDDWLKLACIDRKRKNIDECVGSDGRRVQFKDIIVDVLGCRTALEMADPMTQLSAVSKEIALNHKVNTITFRLCGPEIEGDEWECERDVCEGCKLRIAVKRGLYHEAFPAGGADMVVAMNAGIGVPQYARQWGPTLDLLASEIPRKLVAITTYSPGELVREERLLRRRWADTLELHTPCQLAALVEAVEGPQPWTLSKDVILPDNGGLLRRGDVVEPWNSFTWTQRNSCGDTRGEGTGLSTLSSDRALATIATAVARGPWYFRLMRADAVAYVGPNPTPGRSRNYGKLLIWAGRSGVDIVS